MPLGALLAVFARERRERIGTAIELSSAYRGTALLLGDVLSEDDEYTGSHSKGVVDVRAGDRRRAAAWTTTSAGSSSSARCCTTSGRCRRRRRSCTSRARWTTTSGRRCASTRSTASGCSTRSAARCTTSARSCAPRTSTTTAAATPTACARDAIPLAARVVSVADAYSAMTTRRTYREPMAPGVAMRELRAARRQPVRPASSSRRRSSCSRATHTSRFHDERRGRCVRWCCRRARLDRPWVTSLTTRRNDPRWTSRLHLSSPVSPR